MIPYDAGEIVWENGNFSGGIYKPLDDYYI